jgi:hypothetical protein
MKCVCGYYHLTDWGIDREDEVFQDELKKNNGKEQFIRLEQDLHSRETITEPSERYMLFACPKCGTLKVERKW